MVEARVAGHPAERTHHPRRLNELRVLRNHARPWRKALALGMLWSAGASAEPAAWLEWQAPPECPTAGDIEQRVTQWLGGPLPSDTDMAVRTALAWNGERWEVTLEIAFGDQKGTRQVSVRDCQEAADFVAVAVALAVDPSLAERMSVAAPDAPEDAARQDVTVEATERPSARPEPTPAPRARTPERAPATRAAASDEPSSFRPHLSVSAEGSAGILPDPALGVDVAAGGDVGRLSLSLGGRWLPPNSTAPEQAAAPIDFSLLGARARAAYLFLGPEARVGPSVAVDAGTIRAKQLRSTDDGVVEPWVSLAVGGLGLATLADYVSIFGELEVEIPLTRPSFVLSDESVVHRVDLGARAALGLRFFLFGQ